MTAAPARGNRRDTAAVPKAFFTAKTFTYRYENVTDTGVQALGRAAGSFVCVPSMRYCAASPRPPSLACSDRAQLKIIIFWLLAQHECV